MEYKLEFREHTNPAEWDEFVKSQHRYSFLQSAKFTWVLETLAKTVERIGVYQDNKLIGLLPIAKIDAKRGKYIRLWHGPILSKFGFQQEIFHQIINYLEDYAKKNKSSFVRIQPVTEDYMLLIREGLYSAPTHNLDAEHTLQLDLKGKTVEQVFLNMRKNTRYYINKSQKEGVNIVNDNSDFDSFYRILLDTAKRQGYTPRSKEYFLRIFEAFGNDGLNLYFAEVEGNRIGMGLFLDYGKYRFYLEGGMNPEFSKFYPSYGIQGRSIVDAINKSIEIYDFWGGVSPKDENGDVVPNYPWAGIDLFKRGFGGEELSIVHPHDLPIKINYWLTWIFETIERKKRGY